MYNTLLIVLASVSVSGIGVWYLTRRAAVLPTSQVVQSIEHTIDNTVDAVVDHLTDNSRQRKVIAAAQRDMQENLTRAKALMARLQAHIDGQP